jgi:CelD/BcsL family acetyltransferase involved in cellulose biosynthesis
MDVKIVTTTEGFDQLQDPWEELAAKSETYIYQTFQWNRKWWKYYGREGYLYLILFYKDDSIVGIAPLFYDVIPFSGRNIYSCLRFLGSNVCYPDGEPLIGLQAYTDYLDLIIEPGYEEQVTDSLADHLETEAPPYDEILLEEVPEKSVVMNYMIPVLKKRGMEHCLEIRDASACPQIELDNSWDEYLKRLSKRNRNNTRGYLRKGTPGEKQIFKIKDIEDTQRIPDVFEEMAVMHQKQWNSLGFPGTFYEKRMYNFTKEIAVDFFNRGWLRFKKLSTLDDGRDIGIEMFLFYKKRVYYLHGGRDHEAPLSSKGAGNVLFTTMLKEAIDSGYNVFDFLRGLEEYKLWKANMVKVNKSVVIQNDRKRNRFQVAFVKKVVKACRRLRVESTQMQLFFRERKWSEGISAYYSFLMQRYEAKRKLNEKNSTLQTKKGITEKEGKKDKRVKNIDEKPV